MVAKIFILCIFLRNTNVIQSNLNIDPDNEMEVHEIVTDNETFPFVAAILRKSKYISAGALIDENWVLTGADSLYLIRESVRILRVRLGSANYKSGGVVRRVKYIQIHPYFDDNKPQFDLALIKLSEAVTLNPGLNPIQIQRKLRNPTAKHFLVASWFPSRQNKIKGNQLGNENNKYLTFSRLHPMNHEDCCDQLEVIGQNRTDNIMCLDQPLGIDPCHRDIGVPVFLNGVLWGIISSWKSEDCDLQQDPIFVNLVSPVEISSWIHSVIQGHRWSKKHTVDYEDNFI